MDCRHFGFSTSEIRPFPGLAAFVSHEVGDDFLVSHFEAHAAGQPFHHALLKLRERDLRWRRMSGKVGQMEIDGVHEADLIFS